MTVPPKLLRAYVDETGDRGSSGKSSPYFAFACVLLAEEDDPGLRAAMSRLRRDFGVPLGGTLHWKDHVKTFSRRQHAANVLVAVPGVMIIYVVVEKSAIPSAALMRSNHEIFYNYAAGIVLERILLAARDWPAGYRDAVVKFAHVKGFDHRKTDAYFALRARLNNPSWVPWARLRGKVAFDGQAHWDGLQAADQYAGMLHVAMRQDAFGNFEPHHFLAISSQIRRVGGKAWGYGFKFLGNQATVQGLPWWSNTGI